ncbi:MAG TPA: hypothetical protein IAB13_05980 [Candidatus Avanaerovorax faecigallinarum]|nr:hypothetical protein [Candidatus Avanaerovorax faecigallinarum]
MDKRDSIPDTVINDYRTKRIKYVTATSLIVLAMILTFQFATGKSWLFIVAGVVISGAVLMAYFYEKWSGLKAGKYSALLFIIGYAAIVSPMKMTNWDYSFVLSIAAYVIYCVVREILTYKSFMENSGRFDVSLS